MLLFGFAQVPTTALHGFPAAVQAAAPPHPVPAAEQRGVVQQLVDAHHPGARLGGGALVVGRTLRACKGASWNTNGRTSCHPNMLPQEVDPHYQRTVMVCSKFDNRLKAGPGASPGGGHSRAAAFMAVVLLAGVLLTLLLQCHSVLCLPRAAAGVQRAVGGGQVPERQRLPAPLRQALLRGWVPPGTAGAGFCAPVVASPLASSATVAVTVLLPLLQRCPRTGRAAPAPPPRQNGARPSRWVHPGSALLEAKAFGL